MAISELIEGRCDMMLTGGFDTDNSILNYMCFSKTPAFSKKDCLNPFDATSDGMMVGEGLGMLVIKRLEDAERDGDRIYAVIKGIGTASDGRFKVSMHRVLKVKLEPYGVPIKRRDFLPLPWG
jgi:acyl transferase domain-containing protein